MNIQAVVMAAGAATRFKGVKQLADINGIPMINIGIQHLLAAGMNNITLVLGAHSEKIKQHVPEDIKIHCAEDWSLGLGHSIASAVKNLDDDTSHLLILLADQLAINAEQIRLIVKHAYLNPEHIICCGYNGAIGVPAVFPSHYFMSLSSLRGDQGAKGILHQHHDKVKIIELDSAAIDIDTQEDLANWKEKPR